MEGWLHTRAVLQDTNRAHFRLNLVRRTAMRIVNEFPLRAHLRTRDQHPAESEASLAWTRLAQRCQTPFATLWLPLIFVMAL